MSSECDAFHEFAALPGSGDGEQKRPRGTERARWRRRGSGAEYRAAEEGDGAGERRTAEEGGRRRHGVRVGAVVRQRRRGGGDRSGRETRRRRESVKWRREVV